jgi:2',3'-cyclic-nucleotide 2'-phosphodiesterase (5'-nucleotidase family)
MPTTTAKKSISVVAVIGLTAAVVVFTHGGVDQQGASAACNADARAVETAVAAFEAENPRTTPTPTQLTKSTVNGGPILKSWPRGGALYSISLSSTGTVNVSVPATARAVSYDTANPCASVA